MSRDITVNQRSWLVVTKPSGVGWHVLDPGLAHATSGDVEVFTDRAAAVQAMQQHDPEWEPPEDPPVYREPVERRLEREQRPVKAAARLAVKRDLDALYDADAAEVAPLFDPWQPGLTVKAGDVHEWDGTLVECLQDHTTQADWTPPATPSLWKIHRTDDGDEPLAWMPGLELTTDDQVVYDGVVYDVIQGHTTQEGWEPPNAASLFEPVS